METIHIVALYTFVASFVLGFCLSQENPTGNTDKDAGTIIAFTIIALIWPLSMAAKLGSLMGKFIKNMGKD